MKTKKHYYCCGNCSNTITKEIKETKSGVEIKIHKCSDCGYQYGLKELEKLNPA